MGKKKQVLSERVQPLPSLNGMSDDELRQLCREIHSKCDKVDEERYDLEVKVQIRLRGQGPRNQNHGPPRKQIQEAATTKGEDVDRPDAFCLVGEAGRRKAGFARRTQEGQVA